MNERIRELSEQAEKYALDNVGKGHYGIEDLIYQFQFVDTKMEKFAELIVKECVKKCDFVAAMAEITNTGEMARKTKATANSCARMIKEHFGVE
jgi:hypothetical protein